MRLLKAMALLALLVLPVLNPKCAGAGGMKVVATFLPVEIFAMNVAGERADVSLLIPPGTGAHSFSPRPLDLIRLSEADLVVMNGAGLERNFLSAIPAKRSVDSSAGIALAREGAFFIDPHVWLDPVFAIKQVESIRDALVRLDPSGADYYNLNAGRYIERLSALDREIASGLAAFKGMPLVTYHESMGYFARRYGLMAYSLSGPYAEQPLPRRVRKVYDLVRQKGAAGVFAERGMPEGPLKKIASDLGIRLCTLNILASGEEKEDYYERAMRENLKEISRCLGAR